MSKNRVRIAEIPPDTWKALAGDLWWFIENIDSEAPDRTDRFFALRRRIRELNRREAASDEAPREGAKSCRRK